MADDDMPSAPQKLWVPPDPPVRQHDQASQGGVRIQAETELAVSQFRSWAGPNNLTNKESGRLDVWTTRRNGIANCEVFGCTHHLFTA